MIGTHWPLAELPKDRYGCQAIGTIHMLYVLRVFLIVVMSVSFWSTLRLGGYTIFDVLLPPAVLLMLLGVRQKSTIEDRDLRILFLSQILALASVLPSALMSTNIADHFRKWAVLEVAMLGMLFMLVLLRNRQVLSYDGIRFSLCGSATVCSVFVILQGAFSMFRGLSPALHDDRAWGDLLRPTGLAENPIEAGVIAAFGAILCASLISSRRQAKGLRLLDGVLLLALAVNIFSMIYSASLTAVISLLFGFLVFLVISGRIKILAAASVALFMGSGSTILAYNNLLSDRLLDFFSSRGEYITVQSRQSQITEALSQMDIQSFFLGYGYSEEDLPLGLEIHNALLASDYHFGILGLSSQVLIFVFIVRRFGLKYSRNTKATLAAILIAFLSLYLSGPVLARRSNWIALLALAIYMPYVPSRAARTGREPRRTERRTAREQFLAGSS